MAKVPQVLMYNDVTPIWMNIKCSQNWANEQNNVGCSATI